MGYIVKVWDEATQEYVPFPALQGARGLPGPEGPAGPQGPEGPSPVRGTDYYTEADKAAIISDVLASLPVWEGDSY